MKRLKLTIALLIMISFIAILFTTNVYATQTEDVQSTTSTETETPTTLSSTETETPTTLSSTETETPTTPSTTTTETTPQATTDTTTPDAATPVEYGYSITDISADYVFQTDSTHWHTYIPPATTPSVAMVRLTDKATNKIVDYATLTEKVVSSDETVLKVSETTGEIIPLKAGDATLSHNGKTIGIFTVYVNSTEWKAEFDEFAGVPVIVINDNVNNYMNSTTYNTCYVSLKNPPKLEIKLLKGGKIVDLDSRWVASTEDTDIVSIENGIIKPKKAGDSAQIIISYNNGQKPATYWVGAEDVDSRDYEIEAESDRGVTVKTEKGKEIIIEKDYGATLSYYLNGEIPEEISVFPDVYIKIADNSIVTNNAWRYHLFGAKVGTTTITVERTGKAAETITVRVVESIYEYKQENPDLFPEDFEVIEYDFVEEEEDYEKLNTELLDKADRLTVYVEKETTVKSDVFESFDKYEDRNLEFYSWSYGEEESYSRVQWTFNSNDIKNTNIDFMPGIEISTEKFDNIKTDEVTDGIFIKFLHSGYLPGKAEIEIYSQEAWEKHEDTQKTLNLYYYNPKTNDYENAGTVEYDNGYLRFSIEHCSDYVATELGLKGKKDKVVPGLDDEPKTGDENIVVFATFIAIAALGGIVLVTKKK